MKKNLLLIAGIVCLANMAFAGGIVTNTNQSAAWVRTMVRDASTDIDAVYYNPAALIRLNDGFHFSLNSQTIFQNKDVTNDYLYLSPTPKKFYGAVSAPVFPSIYAVWKKNKIAVSFGFNPIGGGGGAEFNDGLPSMELSIADMVPTLAAYGAQDYRQNVYFKGTSVFFGSQLGVTYKINDKISVFAGARYVSAKNTYEGYLNNVEVNMNGNWVNVSDAFTNLAVQAILGAGAATMISGTMGALQDGGIPASYTLEQVESMGAISAAQRAQIEGGLTAIGIDPTLPVGQIEGACDIAAPQYTAAAQQASAASDLTGVLFNQEADVIQKGWGITPILGVNLTLGENLNIGIKYEFATKIELENDTKSDFITGIDMETGDFITMFPDGAKTRSDMPAMLSLGADYKIVPKLKASAGFHYYWDKAANYGKTQEGVSVDNSEIIDDNTYEIGLGLEFDITEKLLVSGGYLFAQSGVSEDYQSDMSFDLSSSSFGIGFRYKFTQNLSVNLGGAFTMYKEGEKSYMHMLEAAGTEVPVKDTYYMDNKFFGIGVDFSF